ncbi:MAG: pyridoxal phosphate-dependent aminotransferase [Bacilli bacterium]
MSLEYAKKALGISISPTVAMVAQISKLRALNKEILGFNIGEPDFDTPKNINDAIIKAINDNKTRYVDVSGIIQLRQAIVNKLEVDNNLKYDVNQICVSTGAKQSLYNTLSVILNEGDEVIIPTPCWVSYEEMVKLNGAIPIFVPCLDKDFQLDLKAIEKKITSKTKAIIINTPNNPTGAVYDLKSLQALANLAIKYQFYVISDEIYEKLVYDGVNNISIASLNEDIYKRTITINGFAKAYAMTGYRIGYLAGPTKLVSLVNSMQSHTTSNSTTPVQYGALEALIGSQAQVQAMACEYATRREICYAYLDTIPNITYSKGQGAFYIMIDISYFFTSSYLDYYIKTCDDMIAYLLDEAGVACVSGFAFQAPNHIRFSYSNSITNIKQGLIKIKDALEKLQKKED